MAVTSVASTTTSTQLLAVNSARKALIIANDDANDLYVRFDDGTASSAAYSVKLAQNDTYELHGYRGAVNGVWALDGAGSARITEY